MTVYYVWLVIFAICLYLVITDTSIAQLIILYSKWWRLQYEKLKWWVCYNPRNPVVKYLMWRKSMRMAEELMKEFEND
jgi:hypothetical protein